MKKVLAVLSSAGYLTLFNYCVAYAAVVGESHHPASSPWAGAPSSSHAHEDHHGDDGHHADHHASSGGSSSRDHGSSEESDHCCVNLVQDVPSLLPTLQINTKPEFVMAGLALLPDLQTSSFPLSLSSSQEDRGPPGVSAQDGFPSSRSSRAPPSILPSL
jgi:hypothetical protein